jgi:hypothetical protein
MSFTVLVVVHDSEPQLAALLDSIERHLAAAPQLVVVDSGSRDGGAALGAARGAEVVALEGNPGFGAANNAGLRLARHEVTMLLNPDCELVDGSLAALARRAAGRDALLAPRLLSPDGTPQDGAHPVPGRARSSRRGRCRGRCASASSRGARSARGGSAGRSARAWPRGPASSGASGRSIPPRSCSTRTSTCACARAPPASRPSSTPTRACCTTAATPRAPRSARACLTSRRAAGGP